MLAADDIRTLLGNRKPFAISRPDFRRAAVLVPIFWENNEPHVLFTKRSEKVPHHKGQISFPGGGVDVADNNALAAALRETEEEIGIPRNQIQVLGSLDDIITVTHFVVSPFVAVIPNGFAYKLSDFEIDEVFDVPLRELADMSKLKENEVTFEGRSYPIYYFEHKGYNIWGATGKILRQMMEVLRLMPGEVPRDEIISDF